MSNRPANRLIAQASPYLLQHAHNPVDWYPWGEEAFAEARRRDVPILLSVGYSTCYWCHVMERESFEDEAIGKQMSANFVCVKLDREERPDVDDIYMNALVAMRGSGGWPMNVFLEPKTLRPFWCGTYFPSESKGGMASWSQVLSGIANVWRGKREEVLSQAEALAAAVREQLAQNDEPVRVGEAQISEALQQLLKMFDRTQGGFGRAPKFPQPVFLEFLMDVRPLASDDSTADAIDEAVRRTLNGMACGGLFDQAGGGFHRYSVDERWLVPHFEKMLYDNAQLAAVYARAAAADGDAFFGTIARRTLDYVLREMTGPEGEFHSAQDAEVRGREGLNYLWMPEEFAKVVGADDAELAAKVYGLDEGPNFRDPHHPGEAAQNILRLKDRPDRLARELNMPAPALEERLERINGALYEARAKREQPRLDDKDITAWNGMMIGALAEASKLLDEPKYAEAAARAADFARRKLVTKDGALLRSWRAGVDGPGAVLEDYACMIRGLVALHRVKPGGGETLTFATALAAKAAELFRAGSPAQYYDTPEGASDLFVRTFSTSDGAIPSGPSTMLHALLDLYTATGDRTHLGRASELLVALSASIARLPVGAVNATRGLLRFMMDPTLRPGLESVAAGLKAPQPEKLVDDDSIQPVEVYSDRDRVAVTADQPGKLRLVLKIAPGYHIASASPLPDGVSGEASMLTPLRVGIAGGTGITAYADYPEGAEYEVDLGGRTERLLVHRGEIEFDVVLEKSGDVTGRPLLVVTYQACTDTDCLMARTVELDVAVDMG